MTTISTPVCTGAFSYRIAPTRMERLLLRTTHAIEAFTLTRMQRRAASRTPIADDAAERRRTAQALASIGMLPR